MSIVGPHVGAILGALVYQICIGVHWPSDGAPEQEVDVTPMSLISVTQVDTKSDTLLVPVSEVKMRTEH